MTGKQRKQLTKLGHELSPVVYIGKSGLSDEVVKAAGKALADHELIKIRFVDFKKSKEDISRSIAERTGSTLIRVLGNIALLYKENPDPEKRQIEVS